MSHSHRAEHGHARPMTLVLAITVLVVVAQWIGVAVTGSIALAADAGHQLTDALGIALALVAARIAARPASASRTFGYLRAEVLSAVVHAVLIAVMCTLLAVESWKRWNAPVDVAGGGVMAFAFVGLVANLAGVAVLRGSSRTNLNVRTAFLDVAADAATSAIVLVTGALTALTGVARIDIVATAIVTVVILLRTWGVIAEAAQILMEGTPAGISADEVRRVALALPGVIEVHDLHVWAVSPESPMVTAHVVVEQSLHDSGGAGRVLDLLEAELSTTFGVNHTTFQIEHPGHRLHERPHHD